jgi:ribose-phosphate pyrophosphokinase
MIYAITDKDDELVKVEYFPAGEQKIVNDFKGRIVYGFRWIYENDAELFTLYCLTKMRNFYGVFLDMPYIPHARMDRVKTEKDVFTLKFFCQMINSMNFVTVNVLDAHSDVSLALLDRVQQLNTFKYVNQAIEDIGTEDLVVFFPDAGAHKRYNYHEFPSTYGIKSRDWETGRIESLEIANPGLVKGKKVLIIDDICSYGGTFLRSADALKEAGAEEVYLYVSHCENSIFKGKLPESNLIKRVYTTNSLPREDEEYSVMNGWFKVFDIDYRVPLDFD